MSELSTVLYGRPGSRPKTNNFDQLVRLIFGKELLTLDRRDLGAIAKRIFWRVEYYWGNTPIKKSQKELATLITEYIGDVEKLHDFTGKPMIEHRHFGEELDRLLFLAHEIKASIKSKTVPDELPKRLRQLALESRLADTAANTTNREKQADWIGPVTSRANELARKCPKPNTSQIAKEIESDTIANPSGKTAAAIRKVLNSCKIR